MKQNQKEGAGFSRAVTETMVFKLTEKMGDTGIFEEASYLIKCDTARKFSSVQLKG